MLSRSSLKFVLGLNEQAFALLLLLELGLLFSGDGSSQLAVDRCHGVLDCIDDASRCAERGWLV